MASRGIRGATSVAVNGKSEIIKATTELLKELVKANRVDSKQISHVFFTVTSDLDAEFPAVAARQIGWAKVPMLCSYEIAVKKSLKKCIRVLLVVNTWRSQKGIKHVYLNEAKKLRPDLLTRE